LRALDLDNDWLEVSVDGTHKRVTGVGETIEDVIGPMVNREVNVRVRSGRRVALTFIDIKPRTKLCSGALLGRELQSVTDAEFGENVGRAGRVGFELLPQAADKDPEVMHLLGLCWPPELAQ
jgi:hypothetical protein